jgi:cell wall-associated NlpC family hydrolase
VRSARVEAQRVIDNPVLSNAHVIKTHRRPPVFRVGKLVGFTLVVSLSATLFTVSTTASSSGLSTAAPAPSQGLTLPGLPPGPAIGSQALSTAPTVTVEAPPGPSSSYAVHTALKHYSIAPVAASPSKVEIAIGYAMAQRGKPYRWGAAGPNSFDCSGLVMMAERAAGYSLPHFTGTMMHYGHRVSRSQLQRGDIVFPSDHHVGIYLGGGQMIVAPHSGTVVQVQHLYSFYTAIRL